MAPCCGQTIFFGVTRTPGFQHLSAETHSLGKSMVYREAGAVEKSRTSMGVTPLAPQASASTIPPRPQSHGVAGCSKPLRACEGRGFSPKKVGAERHRMKPATAITTTANTRVNAARCVDKRFASLTPSSPPPIRPGSDPPVILGGKGIGAHFLQYRSWRNFRSRRTFESAMR